ncbi:putative OmpL-like beta-barrel porin-2 [Sphingomonas sp. PP-CE-3A-406]|uniref:outer membrane beta-barrel protein n=1 Tax=Sphingomonas sp. PP-CE-3A-406 TaxID=2135659 RepID=UPI000EF9F520|nr:outer membrane beta-barrel protein [Sphingomonas sp. PP-CE-3A-406]RMB52179.1 putative OmpL-like beta-barrel porin-2 [Sphingomonas sp. PP-CE-3A-406]
MKKAFAAFLCTFGLPTVAAHAQTVGDAAVAAPADSPAGVPANVSSTNVSSTNPSSADLSSAGASSASGAYTTDNLGDGVLTRFTRYYALEMGHASAPSDPNAPASRREGWPAQPATTPPLPFTEWPYGGATSIGANRPASVDSPLMTAIAPTGIGRALASAHVQVYGWLDVGGNYSSSSVPGGNAPAAYDYQPRRIQLDQAVVYVERTPDTVQQDHVDWGFRVAGIYGVDYRYTTSLGLFSNQLLKHNNDYGYDLPMVYGEVYIPKIAQGLVIRVGRFIAAPDIEAQLAPNNYMYSHSMTYTFDNYTNTGVMATLAVTKNWFVQGAVTDGSETALWNVGKRVTNPFPNPLYPGTTYRKDPGAQASFTGCVRYQSNSGRDSFYVCTNAINNGEWGYNNLQWSGLTYYHRFTDKWHVAFESYNLYQKNVPNGLNPVVQNAYAMGGTPFSPQRLPFNAPSLAQCNSVDVLRCSAHAQSALAYLNFTPTPLNNITLRGEYLDDEKGQRTGAKTRYVAGAIGYQHWFSPQIEIRPEVAYYRALDANAFNGNSNLSIVANKRYLVALSGDAILHF